MKTFTRFIILAVLLTVGCEEEKEIKAGSSLSGEAVPSRSPNAESEYKVEQSTSDKQQFYIRSHDGGGMEKLKLDSNPYISIEAIGWSKTGLFAYRYKYFVDDGRGHFWVYSFAIINAVNNEIVEQDSIEVEINAQPAEMQAHSKLAKEYKAKWNAMLAKREISGRVDDLISDKFKNDLLKFPVAGFDSWLDYSIKSITIDNKVDNNGIKVDSVKWNLMIGDTVVKKSIGGQIDEIEGMMPNISGRKILGCYKSPHENRIIVALAHYYWISLSGGYHTIRLELFGSEL